MGAVACELKLWGPSKNQLLMLALVRISPQQSKPQAPSPQPKALLASKVQIGEPLKVVVAPTKHSYPYIPQPQKWNPEIIISLDAEILNSKLSILKTSTAHLEPEPSDKRFGTAALVRFRLCGFGVVLGNTNPQSNVFRI